MKKLLFTLFVLLLNSNAFMAREWHVSPDGSDQNKGSQKSPFATISKAAYLALAGDTVLIHGGVYREWVSPANSGISATRRIVYMAVPNEEVWLKGSEVVSGWKKKSKTIWSVEVPNSMFGDFNPFAINLIGDWLYSGDSQHLGEVYLNGEALMEATDNVANAEQVNTWCAKVEDDKTIIDVNFGTVNPNKELIEINVRPTCFFPKTTGMNYITVKGLKIAQAATQWSAPTSEQTGIIGPNWSKGWIIEDCEISNSKCVGICLGKTRASGQNMATLYRNHPGYMKCGFTREIESILKGYDLGWSKENVGSHLIQNNKIFNCGQAGIVGHMGAAFCVIRHNEIYQINVIDSRIVGDEVAGIKLHAAIDTKLQDNCITKCTKGIWLDWQAQGSQVSGNVFAENVQQDLFIEVSHGPTLVYNNIFLSEMGLCINAQGIAYFNNLIAKKVAVYSSTSRYTPYHEAHSTKVKGFFNNSGGDTKFYNNIFLGNSTQEGGGKNGLADYNKYPVYSDDMSKSLKGSSEYLRFQFPVWASNNVYCNQAQPFKGDTLSPVLSQIKVDIKFYKEGDKYYLEGLPDMKVLKDIKTRAINTDMLGQTFISEAIFENTDGTPFVLNTDYFGKARNQEQPFVGPFEQNNVSYIIWDCTKSNTINL